MDCDEYKTIERDENSDFVLIFMPFSNKQSEFIKTAEFSAGKWISEPKKRL